MKPSLLRGGSVVTALLVCGSSPGLTLGPGAAGPAQGTADTALDLSGTQLATQNSVFTLYTVTGLPAMTGALTSRIVRTPAGTLDFYYGIFSTQQVFPGMLGTFPVTLFEQLRVGSFDTFMTDVYYVSPTGAVPPGTFARSADGQRVSADFINPPDTFPFDYPLAPGVDAAEILVRTDATDYVPSWALLAGDIFDARYLGNGRSTTTGTAVAFAPAPIPEPASAALLPLATVGLLLRLRRGR